MTTPHDSIPMVREEGGTTDDSVKSDKTYTIHPRSKKGRLLKALKEAPHPLIAKDLASITSSTSRQVARNLAILAHKGLVKVNEPARHLGQRWPSQYSLEEGTS